MTKYRKGATMREDEWFDWFKSKGKMPESFSKLVDELIQALEETVGDQTPSNYKFKEAEDHYRLDLGLPGYSKSQVTITEQEGRLLIKSQPSIQLGRPPVNLSIPLIQYRYKSISATMENGLLTITLNKTKSDSARRIEIK